MASRDEDDWYYDRLNQKPHWELARKITEDEQKQYKPARLQTLVD